jgi:hypothetical protein
VEANRFGEFSERRKQKTGAGKTGFRFFLGTNSAKINLAQSLALVINSGLKWSRCGRSNQWPDNF